MSKVALVTGASSGIGEAIAIRLATLGYTTYGAARHTDKMAALVEAKGIAMELDLRSEASIQTCAATVLELSGQVDVLVNAGGTALYGAVEDIPLEQARELFEVNLFGAASLVQKLVPHMRNRRTGTIINISSVGGVVSSPYGGWYHATKFAVEGLSSSLRQELNPFGVNVVIIRPEAIKTGWRAIAGKTLLANSGQGAYSLAAQAMHSKYMSPQFDKMVKDPNLVADVVEAVLSANRPKSVYLVPLMARISLVATSLMGTDRVRDAAVRRFIGLPKTM